MRDQIEMLHSMKGITKIFILVFTINLNWQGSPRKFCDKRQFKIESLDPQLNKNFLNNSTKESHCQSRNKESEKIG